MQSNTTRIAVIVVVALFLLGGAFSGGLLVGWLMPVQTALPTAAAPRATVSVATTPSAVATETPKTTDQLFKPFWQAWDLVHKQYVDQPVDDQTLMRGAISGMLSSLGDTHTAYMDPSIYEAATTELTGKTYGGIGAFVDSTGEFLKIISPFPNSPAQKAGLKTGDMIIAVDKQDMTGLTGDVVLKKVLGDPGTNVVLTIMRSGEKAPFDVTLTRAAVTVPMAEGKMIGDDIAYVRLYTFGDTTGTEMRNYLKTLLAKNPKGLILDLRGNGGGWLDTAIQVVSDFIKSPNVVMYEQFGDGTRKTYTARSGGVATDIPLVVLVNEGTASASEITAGAIQDYGRGKLVGVKTYGKGSVQQVSELNDDGGAVRITVARWLTPKERQIHKVGLTPDVEVKITDDDVKNNRDPQLDKALELLRNGLK